MGALWVLILGLAGCRPESAGSARPPTAVGGAGGGSPAATVPAAGAGAGEAVRGVAQAKLPTLKLWLGQAELVTEVARTSEQMAMGMMFRTNMLENEAMLFVHPYPVRASFWMKNTPLPLSCAYIDSDGAILEIRDMKPFDETPIVAGSDQVRYVLETRQGWFERNRVATGAMVRTERGTLGETFFGR